MASAIKIVGYTLQFAGMAIALIGFLMLVMNVQKVIGYSMQSVSQQSQVSPPAQPADCDPETDDLCGADITQAGMVEQLMSRRIFEFFIYLGAGLGVLFLGVLIRSIDEIADFFGGAANKNKRIMAGKQKWGNPFWPPPS